MLYVRHLGPVYSMTSGQWTTETASGYPAICCANCAGIYDIDPKTHRVDSTGFVVPALKCPIGDCQEYSYVRLLNFVDEVLA